MCGKNEKATEVLSEWVMVSAHPRHLNEGSEKLYESTVDLGRVYLCNTDKTHISKPHRTMIAPPALPFPEAVRNVGKNVSTYQL